MPAHWDTEPEAWDGCILGKFRLPGVAEVSAKPARKLDKKAGKGTSGATITDQGGEAAQVTISLSIFTAEDWDSWCLLAPIINPTRVAPQSFDIVHPQTQALGIKSVMVENIDVSPPKSGILSIKITCSEWFPPPKKGASKSKITTPAKSGGATNVLDLGRDQRRAAADAAYQKTSGGKAGPPPPPPSLSENKP